MLGTVVWSSLHSGVVVPLWNSPSIFTRPHLSFGYYGLTHLCSPTKVWKNFPVDTNNAQTLPHPNYCRHTRQVHKYPDSTISKVLTILKMWTITTLNCWKNWEYRTILLPMRYVHIGHFFYNINATVSSTNRLTCLYSDLNILCWTEKLINWQTDKLTDWQNQLLNSSTHVHAGQKEAPTVEEHCKHSTICLSCDKRWGWKWSGTSKHEAVLTAGLCEHSTPRLQNKTKFCHVPSDILTCHNTGIVCKYMCYLYFSLKKW